MIFICIRLHYVKLINYVDMKCYLRFLDIKKTYVLFVVIKILDIRGNRDSQAMNLQLAGNRSDVIASKWVATSISGMNLQSSFYCNCEGLLKHLLTTGKCTVCQTVILYWELVTSAN